MEQKKNSICRQILNFKIYNFMRAIYNFSGTADTTSVKSRSPHPCPFCRCHLANNPTNCLPNLYLTTPSEPTDYMAMTFNPTPHPFTQTAPNLRQSLSLNKTNITFRYSSPLKVKALSVDNRFSTKKYKNIHFPHLVRNEVEDEPVLQIVKNKPMRKPKHIESQQKTPPKHQVLKMNKIKSKGRLELDSKNSLVSKNSLLGSQASSSTHRIQSAQHKIQAENVSQKQTPIDYFKRETSPEHYQQISNPYKGADYLITKSIKNQQLAEPKQVKKPQQKNMQIAKKYPTVKSIQMFKQPSQSAPQGTTAKRQISQPGNVSQTSLKILEQKQRISDWRKDLLICETDRQLASCLSEQLALNYDYFFVNQESDRSLSSYLQL